MRVGPVPQSICCCHASSKGEGGNKGFGCVTTVSEFFFRHTRRRSKSDSILQFALKIIGPVCSMSALISCLWSVTNNWLVNTSRIVQHELRFTANCIRLGQHKSTSANTSQYRPTQVSTGQHKSSPAKVDQLSSDCTTDRIYSAAMIDTPSSMYYYR